MEIIKTFTEFLLEARRSKHFDEQAEERVGNLERISFPSEITTSLRLGGLNQEEVKEKAMAIIKREFYKEAQRIERRDFARGSGVPAGIFKIKVGNAEAYVTMTMKSYIYRKDSLGYFILDPDGNRIVNKIVRYEGEKIYVCVNDNAMATLKVYKIGESEREIARDMASHFVSRGRDVDVVAYPTPPELIHTIEVKDDGTVQLMSAFNGTTYSGPQREQQWSIKVGERIKIEGPFAGQELPIVEIINPEVKQIPGQEPTIIWKENEDIKVGVMVNKDGKRIKLLKTLKPETVVYLPIGRDKDYVRCIVTGKLIDKRQPNPVNLKFRSLE